METIAVARHAMATRFEILLHGENPHSLRAAGEEALDEIERLEAQLSLYRPTSEIARVNSRASLEPVRVSPAVFRLLRHAQELSRETDGTFDISIAPLVRCWGFMGGTGQFPDPQELAAAREVIGMQHVELREDDFTVRFARPGMMLDLGAIGKGYALDRAAELLREAGITSALLHGGTSSILGIGHPPEADAWKIALEYPRAEAGDLRNISDLSRPLPLGVAFCREMSESQNDTGSDLVATVSLRDEALSVSAVWGRAFREGNRTFGHVINPRTGQPVVGAQMAAVVLPSGTETDALSTALLVGGEANAARTSALRPEMRTLLIVEDCESPSGYRVINRGIAKVH